MYDFFEEQTILEKVKEQVSYDYQLGWQRIYGEEVDFLALEKGYLSNVLDQNYVLNQMRLLTELYTGHMGWNCDTPVMISAQTGVGKTTFILKSLLPIARKAQKKVLYLVSRKAQKMHMKYDAMSDEENGNRNGGRSFSCVTKNYPEALVEYTFEFGDIIILSYQEFLCQKKKLDFKEFLFVVCDEAHFFLTDASFNRMTGKILDEILKECRKCIRIYLSATADEISDVIYQEERSIPMSRINRTFQFHIVYMGEDYAYLVPHFFEEESLLIDEIKNSNDGIKWLIFVRKKEEAQNISSELRAVGISNIDFISADNNNSENESYVSILENENLSSKVTLSTKVLDLGINLKMNELRIVIFDDELVEIKQMVGRWRGTVGGKKSFLEVYFYVPSEKILKMRYQSVHNAKNDFQGKYVKYFNQNSCIEKLEFPFYLDENKNLCYNRFYELFLDNEIKRYDKMFNTIYKCMNKNQNINFQCAYAKGLLKKFSKAREFSEEMFLSATTNDRVSKFIERWVGVELDEDAYTDFNFKLLEVLPDDRIDKRKGRKDLPGISVRRRQLKKYGYTIGSKTKQGEKKYKIERTGEQI